MYVGGKSFDVKTRIFRFLEHKHMLKKGIVDSVKLPAECKFRLFINNVILLLLLLFRVPKGELHMMLLALSHLYTAVNSFSNLELYSSLKFIM